jgi:hypothetical protein
VSENDFRDAVDHIVANWQRTRDDRDALAASMYSPAPYGKSGVVAPWRLPGLRRGITIRGAGRHERRGDSGDK